VFLVAAACGGDDGGSTPPDAAPLADAGPLDAALPADVWFVMDSVQLAESANEAARLALDLDGDKQPDNALGGLLAAIAAQADLPIAAEQVKAIEGGRALTLVGLEDLVVGEGGPVSVRIAPGSDLDDDAADNFSGSEPFALAPLEGADGMMPGTLGVGGRLKAGPGTVPVLLGFAGVPPAVIPLVGVGGGMDCEASANGLASGRLGAALTEEEANQRLIPAMAAGIDEVMQRDCPDALCEDGSPGEQLAIFFDDNEDGRLTEEEFLSNSLISSTFGNPDVDLFDADGVYNPGVDGVKDSLSFGVGFTAVPAVLAE
jgi:hypothetical protein